MTSYPNHWIDSMFDHIEDVVWWMHELEETNRFILNGEFNRDDLASVVFHQVYQLQLLHTVMGPDYQVRRSCFHGKDTSEIEFRLRRKPVYFKIQRSTNEGEPFYFTIHSRNHQVLATSEMYTTKQSCKRGIAAVYEGSRKNEQPDIRDVS